ncbi:ABC transporter ATP-binding protein [Goodfellowiella coeruleoviolacea]|uniref:ABC-2 type transport system ATP-binding protein n=1 Tax=Goodfellowiella coeruleoviolacea TaxID=334858 RepID=A0AAE3GJR1_9PSEU|nr:ABC transporter ATP-binding protein [Goodfellowiella coeruleoviolacea]MCP2169480.1 ABC-2 type transport system ATP-binding protein [Goodfellowiella coeruleoviolacea]
MSLSVHLRDLSLRYGETTALDGLSLELAGGKVYGLLGRNGSGKTSLLSVLAARRRASAGTVLVDGEDPFENTRIMRRTCFIRDEVDAYEQTSVRQALRFAARLRPHWDEDYAHHLVDTFKLPVKKKVSALSRGMKSALGITLGLACRAPLTIFDESYLGMDAPSRYAFYDELLSDYAENPRTIILSTHLIEEVNSLFEEIVILDNGRLVLHEEVDTLRARGVSVTGPAEVVDRFTAGLTVLGEQRLGNTKAVTVYERFDDARRRAARAAGLELGAVPVQDLFVHLTRQPEAQR